MTNYSSIKKGVKKKFACGGTARYADGGLVSSSRKGAKTVINIVTPPAAPVGGMPAPGAAPVAPPAAPMGNSPSPAGPPVPPAAAAMALGQMQGKPGAPGAFKRGGRVKLTAGAESGLGRLQASRAAKKK